MTPDQAPDPSVPEARPTGRTGGPPPDLIALADDRARARAEHDWARADELRASIEAAGWKVVDRGTRYRLERAAPPDLVEGDAVRYGSAASVPSVLGEAPGAAFTVELIADDRPDDLGRCLQALRTHAPGATQVVVVANDPDDAQAARLVDGSADLAPIGGLPVEVVRTSTRVGPAAARNIGLRRARGAVVVFADPAVEPTGDALSPLAEALADPTVAVAGGFGVVTADLRRFEEAPGPDVDALEGDWLAFRREEIDRLGPLDEKFATAEFLDAWWSLVLRAGADGDSPRRAVRIELPLVRHHGRDRRLRARPGATGSRSATSTGSSTGSAIGRTSWLRARDGHRATGRISTSGQSGRSPTANVGHDRHRTPPAPRAAPSHGPQGSRVGWRIYSRRAPGTPWDRHRDAVAGCCRAPAQDGDPRGRPRPRSAR